jgi:8-oxo-dGTP pyrophosphatase MutT (NUDIX family)
MIPFEKLQKPHDGSYPLMVAGFLFRNELSEVCLIKKTHPQWQIGKWNGIGGKVEKDEFPIITMQREFQEETGVFQQYWRPFLFLQSDPKEEKKWAVVMYMTENQNVNPQTMTDEQVAWHKVSDIILVNTVPNLRWIIPMAIDKNRVSATVTESNRN